MLFEQKQKLKRKGNTGNKKVLFVVKKKSVDVSNSTIILLRFIMSHHKKSFINDFRLDESVCHNCMSAAREYRIFAYAKTKAQISFAVAGKLISAFVFATRIVQFVYFLHPKFPASNHLL